MKTVLLLLCVLSMLPAAARAGRPFVTDDARLTEAHSCQVESWWMGIGSTDEWVVVPACNPATNFEISGGVAVRHAGNATHFESYTFQGKTLLRRLERGSYGLGLAFGVTRPDRGEGGTDYAYVPLSVMSRSEATVAHFNLGWQRLRALDSDRLTWGAGVEHAWNERLSTFGEIFGHDVKDPAAQVGLSVGLTPGRVHLDVTYGQAAIVSGNSDFYSAGINVYLPPF